MHSRRAIRSIQVSSQQGEGLPSQQLGTLVILEEPQSSFCDIFSSRLPQQSSWQLSTESLEDLSSGPQQVSAVSWAGGKAGMGSSMGGDLGVPQHPEPQAMIWMLKSKI